jgi:RNA polymerase sigma factor (sigma-70 family)
MTGGHGCWRTYEITCFDRLKQSGVRDNSAFDERIHSVGQSTTNPETSLLEKEKTELLREALEALSPEYPKMLVLRELEELSYVEIASITEIPLATVM